MSVEHQQNASLDQIFQETVGLTGRQIKIWKTRVWVFEWEFSAENR
jgi:hypothetical protein